LEAVHWHNSAGLVGHLQAARFSAQARPAYGSPALLKYSNILPGRSRTGKLAQDRVEHFATHGTIAGEIEGYSNL
jgi:hypothetical protein